MAATNDTLETIFATVTDEAYTCEIKVKIRLHDDHRSDLLKATCTEQPSSLLGRQDQGERDGRFDMARRFHPGMSYSLAIH